MDGLQDAIYVKMFALGTNQYLTTILLKLSQKNGLKILIMIHKIGLIKLGMKILKELHLKG